MSGSYLRLATKAIRDPRRAILRLVLRSRLRRLNAEEERARLVAFLSNRFAVDAAAFAEEYRGSEFRRWFQERREALARFTGPYRFGTTGTFGCEAMYLLVRAARPKRVVETGVLYGGSTAHVLAALARNGEGELHSIELGRDEREPTQHIIITVELKARWDLVIGDSRQMLPEVLRRCGSIDMFHHDSLHTWEHMHWEFGTALPYLREGAVLSSDDVLNPPSLVGIFRPNPFQAFCERAGLGYETFNNLGIAVRGSAVARTQENADLAVHGGGRESWTR
jgi:predicted O-methyltransferase YrrM